MVLKLVHYLVSITVSFTLSYGLTNLILTSDGVSFLQLTRVKRIINIRVINFIINKVIII